MKIVVFGAGGVGGYFYGRLAQAGRDVVCIARGQHLAAIAASGLRIDSLAGNFAVSPARVSDSPKSVGTVDMVVLATKTWQVHDAISEMRPLIGQHTRILPLLNGIEHINWLQAAYGRERVLGGISRISAFVEAPGHIKHVAVPIPTVVMGSLHGDDSEFMAAARAEFSGLKGANVSTPPSIHTSMWEKLLFISAVGGVGTATKRPIGGWRNEPFYRGQAIQAMKEAAAVARAYGAAISSEAVGEAMANVDALDPMMTPSMQKDIEHGHPSELDAQLGAIVRFGRAAGVPTPTIESLYNILLPLERAARARFDAPPVQADAAVAGAARG